MDLQTLEQRLGNFIDVFTPVESESKLIKSFVDSFFLFAGAGDPSSPSTTAPPPHTEHSARSLLPPSQ